MFSLKNAIKFGNEKWGNELLQRISWKFQKVISDENVKEILSDDESSQSNRDVILNLPFNEFSKIIQRNDLRLDSEDFILKLVIEYITLREGFEEKDDSDHDPFFGERLFNYKDIFSQEYLESQSIQEIFENDIKMNIEKSEDTINFNLNWNSESLKNLRNYKLSSEDKRNLLKKVRLSFVSHSYLISVTKLPILKEFIDLILEAMSLKLSRFEPSEAKYSINSTPRNKYITLAPRVIGKGKITYLINL
jgi:hypothetical protein